MKKIFLYLLALLPVIFIVSILMLASLIFPITLLPENILPVKPIYITEIVVGILLGLYGFRLRRLQISKTFQIIYWFFLGISTGILLFLNYGFIILLQPSLFIVYSILLERRMRSFKTYFQRSRDTLVAFNLFDAFFIGSYFLLKYIIKENMNKIDSFVNELPISRSDLDLISLIFIIFLLFIFIPIFRGFLSVWIYKKQNRIFAQTGKVFWNSNIKSYGTSAISIYLYISMFFQTNSLNLSTVLIYLMLMSFTVYFWITVYEGIDRGGEDKEGVISNWALIGLVLIFLVLLDQIESDIIGILTWFLPMLLPIFIGEVNSIIPRGYLKSPTPAMKKHIYWLQIMSFNTLFVFNIMSSLSTKQIIKNEQIEQINILKKFLISVFDRGISSNFTLGIFVSFIILLCSIAVAYVLSKIMIYLIRRSYIERSNRYFN